MRVVAAMFKHETNPFSPMPTPLPRFARSGTVPYYGEQAMAGFKGTGTSFAAFLDLAKQHGASVVTPDRAPLS
jgi:microcystin degradation protein MlrC